MNATNSSSSTSSIDTPTTKPSRKVKPQIAIPENSVPSRSSSAVESASPREFNQTSGMNGESNESEGEDDKSGTAGTEIDDVDFEPVEAIPAMDSQKTRAQGDEFSVPPATPNFQVQHGQVHAQEQDSFQAPPSGTEVLASTHTTPTQQRTLPARSDSQKNQGTHVAANFRELPLLSADLPHTTVTVSHSFVRPNERGKEVLSFLVHVDPGQGKVGWKVEKMYSDVLGLDQRVRSSVGKGMGKKIASLPEGKLWRDHAPAKVDQRKVSNIPHRC